MEHEIFVPFSATVVRAALAEPQRVARCFPGFQPEAGDDPDALRGRLRVRIGGSTITYRGTMEIGARGEGLTVRADATEARGNGSAKLRLEVVPRPVADGSGSTLSFSGTVAGGGRITEFEPRQRQTTARRLLDRFTEALVTELAAEEPALGRPDDNEPVIPGIPAPDSGDSTSSGDPAGATSDSSPDAGADRGDTSDESAADPGDAGQRPDGSLADADVPPPSLDPGADPDEEQPTPGPAVGADDPRAIREEQPAGHPADHDGSQGTGADEDDAEPVDIFPPADPPEADLARRTMIGRSAEEVDHAPPRGRYAPQPAAGAAAGARDTLRWAAPAAALAVAGAIAVTRLVRRRR